MEVDPRGGVVAWTLFEMDEGSPPFRTAPLFGRDEEKRSKKGLLKRRTPLVAEGGFHGDYYLKDDTDAYCNYCHTRIPELDE